MKLVFISDLHLSPDTPQNNQLLFDMLISWQQKIDGLYILGDFFDYYLGDDDNTPFTLSIKKAFSQFTQYTPIYFIGGNHDFGLGRKFAHETGITIIRDLSTITIAGNTILLSHGDAFCTLDVKYQRMKKILQNPILMFILRRIPLSWRYKLKEKLEKKSASVFNAEANETYLVVNDTISQIARQKQTNIVIHGHTHQPGRYLIQTNDQTIERYEIPDWADRPGGGYIMLEDNIFKIHNPADGM